MSTLRVGIMVGVLAALVLGASGAGAQEALSVRLHPSGKVQVLAGEAELATVELNAHGPEWQHAPQTGATAQVKVLPEGVGTRFVGVLPVPNTEGGALEFTETVRPLPQSLRLQYEVGVTQAMRLNGLQVSVGLPVAQYAGREIVISRPDEDEPQVAFLPEELREDRVQIWGGEGARLEVAKGTDRAITIELQAGAEVVIQDLRRWEQPTFEIRFPAIMENPPRQVAREDRFHLDLMVIFASPVSMTGP